MASGKREEAQAIIHETSKSKAAIKELEEQLNVIAEERTSLLLRILTLRIQGSDWNSEEDNEVVEHGVLLIPNHG